MASVAEKLDGQNLTQGDVESRVGVFDEAFNCYRFPDGSAGRLINIEWKGNGSAPNLVCRFIYLRAESTNVVRAQFNYVSVGMSPDRIRAEA